MRPECEMLLLMCDRATDTVVHHPPGFQRGGNKITRFFNMLERNDGPGIRVRTIYKICPASIWREAERTGTFRGSVDDLRDGFIHFSTASQVEGTARKHFSGQAGLFLIAIDANGLGDALRWEVSRGGELFPHLYGELDLGHVTAVLDMRARSDGTHDIPELAP
jgi:uncharacterized protein (DUF952 family)